MTRAQRSYHAFLKAIKAQEGISHAQAQAVYRSLRDRLGAAPAKADIKRHPRMTRDAVRMATVPKKRPRRTTTKKTGEPAAGKAPKKATAKKATAAKKAPAKKRAPAPVANKKPEPKPIPAVAHPGERILHAGFEYWNRKSGQLRIEVALAVPKKMDVTSERLNEMLQQFVNTGELPKGVRVDVISWNHKGAWRNATRAADIADARDNFRAVIGADSGEGFEDLG